MKRCRECGKPFTPKQDHHHTCFPCWKAQQSDDDDPPGFGADVRAERDDARARLRILEAQLLATQAMAAHYRNLYQAAAERLAAPSSSAIPPEQLRRLLLLCHPDRHDNSRAANEATAWLLSLRPKEDRV